MVISEREGIRVLSWKIPTRTGWRPGFSCACLRCGTHSEKFMTAGMAASWSAAHRGLDRREDACPLIDYVA